MRDYNVLVWSMSDLSKMEKFVANKTNNALERYNRHFNQVFPSKHPSLLCFAENLRKEMDRIIQRIENVRKGREDPPTYQETTFPPIPQEYESFRYYASGTPSPEKKEKKTPMKASKAPKKRAPVKAAKAPKRRRLSKSRKCAP